MSEELRLSFDEIRSYIEMDNEGLETLVVPSNVLLEWCKKDTSVWDEIKEEIYDYGSLIDLSHDEQESILKDILEFTKKKVMPDFYEVGADKFRRFVCDMLDMSYQSSIEAILYELRDRIV